MTAAGIRVTIAPLQAGSADPGDSSRRWKAGMCFMLEQGLSVVYGGFHCCAGWNRQDQR